MTQYALSLCGVIDELLVGVFKSERGLRKFAAANPPDAVDGPAAVTHGPLYDAMRVRGCGPSLVLGYSCTKVVDGRPVECKTFYWGDTDSRGAFVPDEPFDPAEPLS